MQTHIQTMTVDDILAAEGLNTNQFFLTEVINGDCLYVEDNQLLDLQEPRTFVPMMRTR